MTYGPADGKTRMPSGSDGSVGGTAQKNVIVVIAAKLTTGRVNRTTSVLPRAVTPRAACVLPARTSAAPTMSPVYCSAPDSTPSASVRLMARAKALARTGVPSLKRNPLRSLNVCVLPSREIVGKSAATSGTRRSPSGAGLSGIAS